MVKFNSLWRKLIVFAGIIGSLSISAFSQSLILTSPTGGENWDCGSVRMITWSGSGLNGNFTMSISPDGSTWRNVKTGTPNDSTEAWTIPFLKQTTSSIRMQISGREISGTPISDTSGTFTLTLVIPDSCEQNDDSSDAYFLNSGDSVSCGKIPFVFFSNNQDIDWFSFTGDLNDTAVIRYHFYNYHALPDFFVYVLKPDGSLLTSEHITSPSNIKGSIHTNLPEAGKYYIRIVAYDWKSHGCYSLVYEKLDIDTTTSITLTSPNGGEKLIISSLFNITWTHSGTIGNVKIEYSTNNGSDWNTIENSSANDGIHPWTVPDAPSSNCKIRISEASDGDPVDESNAVFTIEPTPGISVTSPDGGETFVAGSQYDITWTTIGTVENVKIEYSTDNGANWLEVVASTANDGTHSWTTPDTPSVNCKIRISEAPDGSPFDESNAVFTIDNQSGVNDIPDFNYSGDVFLAVPNPVSKGQAILFLFTPSRDITGGEVRIYDPLGNEMFANDIPYCNANKQCTIGWNLKGKDGKPASAGSYLAIVTFTDSEGKVTSLKTIIGVKKEK